MLFISCTKCFLFSHLGLWRDKENVSFWPDGVFTCARNVLCSNELFGVTQIKITIASAEFSFDCVNKQTERKRKQLMNGFRLEQGPHYLFGVSVLF